MKDDIFFGLIILVVCALVGGVTYLAYLAEHTPHIIVTGTVSHIEYHDGFWHNGETVVYLSDGTVLILNGQISSIKIGETYEFQVSKNNNLLSMTKVRV